MRVPSGGRRNKRASISPKHRRLASFRTAHHLGQGSQPQPESNQGVLVQALEAAAHELLFAPVEALDEAVPLWRETHVGAPPIVLVFRACHQAEAYQVIDGATGGRSAHPEYLGHLADGR